MYPAKLLLFGEYTILLGSLALSIPFNSFGATLRFPNHEQDDRGGTAAKSNQNLQKLCEHFLESPEVFHGFLDLHRFHSDIDNGLYLSSTIPQCYGMGSSGALCASIYSNYGIAKNDISSGLSAENMIMLRQMFIRMESFFHGRSSGFDPLVSYLKKPLLLGGDGVVTSVDLPDHLIPGHHMLLIDSGLPCNTGPLVREFLSRFAPHGNITPAGISLSGITDACIGAVLRGDRDGTIDKIIRLSKFQLTELNHLIPKHFQACWSEGLLSGLFTLKLCGSGGGGYLICFTHDKKQTVNYFETNMIPIIQVHS